MKNLILELSITEGVRCGHSMVLKRYTGGVLLLDMPDHVGYDVSVQGTIPELNNMTLDFLYGTYYLESNLKPSFRTNDLWYAILDLGIHDLFYEVNGKYIDPLDSALVSSGIGVSHETVKASIQKHFDSLTTEDRKLICDNMVNHKVFDWLV